MAQQKASRAIWSGALNFGLVNIPVRLLSATTAKNLDFDLLHKTDLCPIRYARVCKKGGDEIPYDEIVKGYEYKDGEYVVLTNEDFEKANVRATKAIDILDFTNEKDIDSLYFEKPYFLEPEKGAEKPYVLLREALKKSKKVGIAKFVLRNRQHIGAIKPIDSVIILDQMRYFDELRDSSGLKIPDVAIDQKEIEMALTLINQSTGSFNPEEYTDTYIEELKKMIEQKAQGKEIKPKGEEPQPTNVSDLLETLKASLKQQKQSQPVAA